MNKRGIHEKETSEENQTQEEESRT
jgi:hypothetical protein